MSIVGSNIEIGQLLVFDGQTIHYLKIGSSIGLGHNLGCEFGIQDMSLNQFLDTSSGEVEINFGIGGVGFPMLGMFQEFSTYKDLSIKGIQVSFGLGAGILVNFQPISLLWDGQIPGWMPGSNLRR